MKKLSQATMAAAARHPNLIARLVLVFVAALLVMLLALIGAASGPSGVLAFAQESPTPTPTDTGAPSTEPMIHFLNPSAGYDPGTSEEPPQISDWTDGQDELYHVVAWTASLPPNPVVEAYYTPQTVGGIPLPEVTIGTLDLVAGTNDTWETFWDIPDQVNDGPGIMAVRLFSGGLGGFEEVANHELEVRMEHEDDDPPPSGDGQFSSETVELTWPSQNGELGFFKPKGGAWRGVVDASLSAASSGALVYYTTSAPGEDPEWTQCSDTGGRSTCTLAGADLPSQITALTAVSYECQDQFCFGIQATEEAADAHRIRPYLQDPAAMSIKVLPLSTTDSNFSGNDPVLSHRRVVAPNAQTGEPHRCLGFVVEVRDDRNREVMGASIDIHAIGPNDQLQFGDEDVISGVFVSTENSSSAYKKPDKGTHATELGENCDRGQENDGQTHFEKPVEGEQGDHNRPAQDDEKHRESTAGTGLSGGTSTGFGRYNFHLWSPSVGLSEVTAWIDDEPLVAEDVAREVDDDTLEVGEPSASVTAQWLPQAMSVSITPTGATAAVGSCQQYTVRARAGTTAVPNINVDVHATGPNNDLDFCDPGEGSPRQAPELTGDDHPHRAEDAGEAAHRSTNPQQPETQHTEGQTDDQGNFTIGITSPVNGDTTLQAWIDGEAAMNNDVLDSAEPNATASHSWAGSIEDAEISFVNPSPYGGAGTNVSDVTDADDRYHIVTRVDAIGVPGVELFVSSDNTNFTKIGDAARVGSSDTWELFWDVNVPDASYTLRAQVTGTSVRENQTITVNSNSPSPPDPRNPPAFETLELTRPTNSQVVPFVNRETEVEGVASAGTEGVDLFYTKVGAKDTPPSAAWIFCGFAQPDANNQFAGTCRLQGSDQASQVTGIAAISYDCTEEDCDPSPSTGSTDPRDPGAQESGDAHRVFGLEGRPLIVMEPAEAAAEPGACQRFTLQVVDSSGQALPGSNVDLHLTGPADSSHFCDPETGATARRSPDQGGHGAESGETDEGFHADTAPPTRHTEGETNGSGRFVFGITSAVAGDSQLLAWVDQNDDDIQGSEEASDSSIMHWRIEDDGGGNGGNRCTVRGDGGDNVLRGTPGPDIICGGGGHDRLIGHGGRDILRGGAGGDILRGGPGRDTLRGGGGVDRLRAGGGNDRLHGNGGNDFLNGQAGRDVCRGGRGRDRARNCEE